jgi:glycosyltransferase involved in cell wall biosynthesis
MPLAAGQQDPTMRVAHLVAGDLGGGAARGALWLHRALVTLGIDSTLLTDGPGLEGDATVRPLLASSWSRLAHRVARRLDGAPTLLYPRRVDRIFSTGTRGLDWARHEAVQRADVVHLHWVNGLVKIESLSALDKPLVWTLRDLWPFTGGCHVAMDCEAYRSACGRCPQLGSSRLEDLSRRIVERKLQNFPAHLVPVAMSAWLAEAAQASAVFRGRAVQVIPNGIDTQRFAPLPAEEARHRLGLPPDRRVVMFASQYVGDFHKGFDLFRHALGAVDPAGLQLLVVGRAAPEALAGWSMPCTSMGFVTDDERLRLAYAAADVFVAPSRMESFGKSLAEAQACGTPVVCFDATGPRDIVEHRVTGWRARPFESDDLAAGIRWVLSLPAPEHERLRHRSRERAVALFDSRSVAGRYAALYRRVLGRDSESPKA